MIQVIPFSGQTITDAAHRVNLWLEANPKVCVKHVSSVRRNEQNTEILLAVAVPSHFEVPLNDMGIQPTPLYREKGSL